MRIRRQLTALLATALATTAVGVVTTAAPASAAVPTRIVFQVSHAKAHFGDKLSIQGQVLNILEDMRQQFGLAMLFISHDLSVVHNICDRIAVMYLGQIVEVGPSVALTRAPRHHYTRALLDSVAVVDPELELDDRLLAGEIPSPLDPPSGCRFRGRCPRAEARCADEPPPLVEIDANRFVACHFQLGDPAGDGATPVHVTFGGSPAGA